mmetsp:Transcript_8318/g.12865  ORF Transcript_8318/g.12865 Transcript_8318/m.12865 type:complete len:221 (+) Transcript_8318:205-867(+)
MVPVAREDFVCSSLSGSSSMVSSSRFAGFLGGPSSQLSRYLMLSMAPEPINTTITVFTFETPKYRSFFLLSPGPSKGILSISLLFGSRKMTNPFSSSSISKMSILMIWIGWVKTKAIVPPLSLSFGFALSPSPDRTRTFFCFGKSRSVSSPVILAASKIMAELTFFCVASRPHTAIPGMVCFPMIVPASNLLKLNVLDSHGLPGFTVGFGTTLTGFLVYL